jgi:hypothetical protein
MVSKVRRDRRVNPDQSDRLVLRALMVLMAWTALMVLMALKVR